MEAHANENITKKVLRYKSYMVLFLIKDKELIRYLPAWLMSLLIGISKSPKYFFLPKKELVWFVNIIAQSTNNSYYLLWSSENFS